MNVLAVDPGLATGYILFRPISRLEIEILLAGEAVGEQAFYNTVRQIFEDAAWEPPGWCVCEDWKPRNNRYYSWEPEPIWIAGAMRMRFGTGHITMQQVGDALRYGTETKLAPYRDRVPKTKDDHQSMALRHALLWSSQRMGF